MKIEINNKEQNTDIKFPCLMISDNENTVIIATEKKSDNLHGFALKSGFGIHFSKDWDMSVFKPFNGSITLSNK
jgi:hypothetical protein